MTTTFQSREAVRDELAALFTANGSWQAVYNYMPGYSVIAGLSPALTILSAGTRQQFAGVWNNPVSYRFEITCYVVSGSESDATVTSAVAQDEQDTLDKVIRQVIRDNVQLTNGDNMRFGDDYSNVERGSIGNQPYIRETYTVYVDLPKGST